MEFSIQTIHQNLKRYKNNVAFVIEGKQYSYADLSQRIAILQGKLASLPDQQYFGVVTRNEIDTYAVILALWFYGKTSVPINPHSPYDRNLNIIAQVGIQTIFDAAADYLIIENSGTISTKLLTEGDSNPIYLNVSDEIDLYLLFTSGSTGQPKGVRISRGNLNAYLEAQQSLEYKLSSNDRCLQAYELTFDASVQCYTLPLLYGASIYTLPEDELKFLAILKVMQSQSITFAKMTPSAIFYLQAYFERIYLPEVKYCLFGAEALPINLAEKWQKCVPNAVIQNVYGPTETTVNCTHYSFTGADQIKAHNGIISIGKPYIGTKAIIVDENQELASAGKKGELCISGTQVCKGYWKNVQLNATSFFTLNGAVYYKTGDLVISDHDGDLFFLGRMDSQIQINGHRIELSEIENHAHNLTSVKCLALTQKREQLHQSILLFVESKAFSSEEVYQYLRKFLPDYMLPSKILFIDQMPLLPSSKTDRQQLLKMVDHA